MDWIMQITTTAIGSGIEGDWWRPKFHDEYEHISWDRKVEIEGMPDPNVYVIEVKVTEAVKDALLIDNSYTVLWVEEYIPEEEI